MIGRSTLLNYIHAHNARVAAGADEDKLGRIVAEQLFDHSTLVTDDDGTRYVVERQSINGISIAPRVTKVSEVK